MDNPLFTPVPLEQEYPELAEHFRLIANGQHPAVKTLVVESNATLFVLHEIDPKTGKGRRVIKHRPVIKIGRNDPCSCGSGRKFKKCCGP